MDYNPNSDNGLKELNKWNINKELDDILKRKSTYGFFIYDYFDADTERLSNNCRYFDYFEETEYNKKDLNYKSFLSKYKNKPFNRKRVKDPLNKKYDKK